MRGGLPCREPPIFLQQVVQPMRAECAERDGEETDDGGDAECGLRIHAWRKTRGVIFHHSQFTGHQSQFQNGLE